jgi:hypothetical protein
VTKKISKKKQQCVVIARRVFLTLGGVVFRSFSVVAETPLHCGKKIPTAPCYDLVIEALVP